MEYMFQAPFCVAFIVCAIITGLITVHGFYWDEGPAMVFSLVVGFVGAHVIRFAGYIFRALDWDSVQSVAMWIFGILISLFVLLCIWAVIAEQLDRARYGRKVGLAAWIRLLLKPTRSQRRPTVMYHGTKALQWAMDILLNNRWRIGASGGVWVTSDFQTALQYAGATGVIIEVFVSPVAILSGGNGVWYAPLPNLRGKFVSLIGITPKRILDVNGNQIM